MDIQFNRPEYSWKSILAVIGAARSGTLAGNGKYTKKCHAWFENKFGFKKSLLTTSCTDALEMAALLTDLQPGDEIILPSFTFMSTANAFLLRHAKVVFADTTPDVPNIDPSAIEALITSKTKAIAVVHYSGIACDMDRIMQIAQKHHLKVIEDAAHAIGSLYKDKPLGTIGNFGAFSFHETKNIFSGEGGLLTVNDEQFVKRAEIIWEKGTNRAAFYRGEVDKYNWVDIGSSFLPSDAVAAFLYVQLTDFNQIQTRRKKIWWEYYNQLKPMEEKGFIKCPVIPDYATVNGNMFYLVLNDIGKRDALIDHLKKNGIQAVFHYFPLHSSPYFKDKHDGRPLPNTQKFSDCIIRLPFYNSLKPRQIRFIVEKIKQFYS
jgi:dTDP-4-amino-4,6-dideoxygalactose transaminase